MSLALIVDDHLEGLYLLHCLLEAEGFQVVEAHDGREALEVAAGRDLDLVISDILMPAMDGFSLCRAWKGDARLCQVPFIFYTATYVDKRDEELAMSLGADLFLVKPTEPTVLMDRVRDVLSRRREGKLPAKMRVAADTPFLQQYNQVLIHKLEDKLDELEKTNQSLRIKDFALASSTDGILMTSLNGKVTYANPAIVCMTGKHSADILGHPVSSLFATSTAFDKWLARQAVNDKEGPLETQVTVPPQASPATWLRIEKHTIASDEGAALGMMFLCANVTEERNLRRELARVQRLEALSLFAAGVAHDFNNLLMAIFAGLDFASSTGASDQESDDSRAMARAAFERARDLTGRLLSFAKGSTSERQPTDLRRLLNESIALSLSGSAIQCEKHYCETPPIADVDPGQIGQVLSNILVNARQAMGDKGTLWASVALVDLPAQNGEGVVPHIKVSIADGGPGIPPDILPDIFEPYFTTKKEGSGLGLAISHAIVTEHGGQISVASQPGAGARFDIVIPAARCDRTISSEMGSDAMEVRSGRILVMDDEVAIQSLLQHGLSRIGYSVVVVGNGEQALLEFQRAQTDKHPFDLCLLDITVRGGMGGVETLAELQRLDPGVVAIATTGYAVESTSPNLQARGFARVIAKPFLLHEILATIKAVFP